MTRLELMDLLCMLCRHARARGNGFAFSYPPYVIHLPVGLA